MNANNWHTLNLYRSIGWLILIAQSWHSEENQFALCIMTKTCYVYLSVYLQSRCTNSRIIPYIFNHLFTLFLSTACDRWMCLAVFSMSVLINLCTQIELIHWQSFGGFHFFNELTIHSLTELSKVNKNNKKNQLMHKN